MKSSTAKFRIVSISLLLSILIPLMITGCGKKLSGEYANNDVHYGIKFSTNGECSMFFGTHDKEDTISGTYYWDSSRNSYVIDLKFQNVPMSFYAVQDGNKIAIDFPDDVGRVVFEKGKLEDYDNRAYAPAETIDLHNADVETVAVQGDNSNSERHVDEIFDSVANGG